MEYQFSGISLGHQDGCNLFVHGHEKVAAVPICVKIKDFGLGLVSIVFVAYL